MNLCFFYIKMISFSYPSNLYFNGTLELYKNEIKRLIQPLPDHLFDHTPGLKRNLLERNQNPGQN